MPSVLIVALSYVSCEEPYIGVVLLSLGIAFGYLGLFELTSIMKFVFEKLENWLLIKVDVAMVVVL